MERQADAAERWCHANGHTLNADLRLSDAGLSAFKGDHLSKGALGRFLDMAQSGDLGSEPVLLVEAIDRLSRLEAIDGLQDVLLALVRAGVTIVSLEDGQEYSRTTLREDGSKLIILVVKCQAAHEYSQRLSRRVTAAWDQARDDLGKGILRRAQFHRPPWCRMDGDQMVLIPEGVETIKTVFEYSRIDGAAAVARRLNAEGVPAFSKTGRWSTSIVRKLLVDTRIWGAVTTNQSARLGVAAREEAVAAGKAEQIFPGVLPAALPKEKWTRCWRSAAPAPAPDPRTDAVARRGALPGASHGAAAGQQRHWRQRNHGRHESWGRTASPKCFGTSDAPPNAGRRATRSPISTVT